MERYRSYNTYMKELFGEKVYKLSVDGGMTCPNRDGTKGTRGCSFCLGGSGAFSEFGEDIDAQLTAAKYRVSSKYRGNKFIAYYQSYTNTYAPVSYLRKVFSPALSRQDIVGISIGTRPDCVAEDVLELLSEMNRIKPVWVELGLQTIHDSTAADIRRGYELSVYDEIMQSLHSRGINTVTHIILGLPGETRDMMLETVKYVGAVSDGIKLQLLHILDGTDMAADYLAGKFTLMAMEEYISLLADCVSILPPDTVIHRLTGDGDKKHLIAPMWSADKKNVLNGIKRYFDENDIVQGKDLLL